MSDRLFIYCKRNEHHKCPGYFKGNEAFGGGNCNCDCGHNAIAPAKVEIPCNNEVKDIEKRNEIASIHSEWMEETEKAKKMDDSSILEKLADTFCPVSPDGPPRKFIHEMTPDEIIQHKNKLQDMIHIIKVHVQTVEREAENRRKTNKKEMEEADKKYKPLTKDPLIVSSKLNTVEKALWNLSKQITDDEMTQKEEYVKIKKIWSEKGMTGVKEYVEENTD